MRVDQLSLKNFRNLDPIVLKMDPHLNIFHGQNAQGKTNLLESIWMFTGFHSFRNAKDKEIIQFGKPITKAEISFEASNRQQEASITLGKNQKVYQLNQVTLQSQTDLSGEFCAVIFSPEHLSLVKDGPLARRNFLDNAIFPLHPRHAAILSAYRKTLIQRNALLKDIPHHPELLDTLDIWDERLAKLGGLILLARTHYLHHLLPKVQFFHQSISNGKESATFSYTSTQELQNFLNGSDLRAEDIQHKLLHDIQESRSLDIKTGMSNVGPHRDDLDIKIGGISARTFASQGQQRTAALALKLGEASVLSEILGEPPVLLLDDVFSELDQARRAYLTEHIRDMQVFITCCEPEKPLTKFGTVFTVQQGKISPDHTVS